MLFQPERIITNHTTLTAPLRSSKYSLAMSTDALFFSVHLSSWNLAGEFYTMRHVCTYSREGRNGKDSKVGHVFLGD